MGEKTRTIFTVMENLKHSILVKGDLGTHKFSDTTKQALIELDNYIKSGALGTSEKMKFILENYEYEKPMVVETWNISHSDDALTLNAIRIQECRLNQVFITTFGLPEVIESAFLSEDLDTISTILDTIRVMESGDTSINTYFTKELISKIMKEGMVLKGVDYSIADCSAEIDYLLRISNINLLALAEQLQVNNDKLAYVLRVLNQPMIKKSNAGLNKEKFDLVTQLHKELKTKPLERVVETKEFLVGRATEQIDSETDYKQLYMELAEKYNELQTTIKLQQESNFESASSLVSNLFSEDIAIPNAVMDILNDIAKDYDGDKVLRMDDAKDFGDTLFALTKYAMPIVVKDIASLDEKMLYCIWAALNDKLEVENSTKKATQKMIEQFKTVMLERVELLQESDYVSQTKQILEGIVSEKKGEEVNE